MTLARELRLFVLSLLFVVRFGLLLSHGQSADQAVAFQVNASHTGAITTTALAMPLSVKWSVNLNATVSYPLIAEGKVFVLAGDSTSNSINLYALDQQTGGTIWGPVLVPRGSYWWAAAAYDNGTIFVTPDGATSFGSGAMYAYSASTGQLVWSANLAGQYLFNSPPTVFGGKVYTAGAGGGGTLYAVDEASGNTLWVGSVANGNNSSPVATLAGVFASYVCPQVYRFNPNNGKLIWNYNPGCDGGGGNTPVLYGHSLYVRDSILVQNYNGITINALDGTVLGYFNADFSPSFWKSTGYFIHTNVLSAISLQTGFTLWTASPTSGDTYSSAPIVVNGIVFVGTSSGNVIAYRGKDGLQLASVNLGHPISAYDGDTYAAPQSGLGAAQGLLIVPASTYVFALQ